MDRDAITPLLITFNEIQNIERTLAKLGWAKRIVVIDSGSTDGTLDVLAKDARIEVIHRPFDSFAEQCNFGLTHIRTDWVLSLDADYELSDPFISELAGLQPAAEDTGYKAAFIYRIYGHPLRGTLYPPRAVLYRVAGARYENEGHGHRIRLQGRVTDLKGPIYHDDRKPLSRWIASQIRYMKLEAEKLVTAPPSSLGTADRIRKLIVVAPPTMFLLCLFGRGGVLEGWPGLFYALQRTAAELILSLSLVERRVLGPVAGRSSSD